MKTLAEQKELFIAKLAEGGLEISKKQADLAFKAFEEVIKEDLVESGKTKLPGGIGSLEVRYRAEREGVNPSTQEKMPIPETLAVGYSAGKAVKDLVIEQVDIAPYREAYLAAQAKKQSK